MSVSSPRPEQSRLNLEPPEDAACVPGEAVAVSSEPNLHPAAPPDEPAASPAPRPRPRRWARIAWLVVFVIFCLELGFLLIILPWTQFWTSNSLVAGVQWLRPLLENNFVRGAVSGLGVLDLWIGIAALVSYREPRP